MTNTNTTQNFVSSCLSGCDENTALNSNSIENAAFSTTGFILFGPKKKSHGFGT